MKTFVEWMRDQMTKCRHCGRRMVVNRYGQANHVDLDGNPDGATDQDHEPEEDTSCDQCGAPDARLCNCDPRT